MKKERNCKGKRGAIDYFAGNSTITIPHADINSPLLNAKHIAMENYDYHFRARDPKNSVLTKNNITVQSTNNN